MYSQRETALQIVSATHLFVLVCSEFDCKPDFRVYALFPLVLSTQITQKIVPMHALHSGSLLSPKYCLYPYIPSIIMFFTSDQMGAYIWAVLEARFRLDLIPHWAIFAETGKFFKLFRPWNHSKSCFSDNLYENSHLQDLNADNCTPRTIMVSSLCLHSHYLN